MFGGSASHAPKAFVAGRYPNRARQRTMPSQEAPARHPRQISVVSLGSVALLILFAVLHLVGLSQLERAGHGQVASSGVVVTGD